MIGQPWLSSCLRVTMSPQGTSLLTVVPTLGSVSDVKATILSRIVHCRSLTIKKKERSKNKNKSKDKEKDKDKDTDTDEPVAKKPRIALAAWKYLEPKDLTTPLIDGDGKEWKFCTKCKCRKTDKVGIYQLSHFDSEHIHNFAAANEGNLASIQDPDLVPSGIPSVTTIEPRDSVADSSAEDIEFVGAWCAPVVSFADPDLTPDFGSPHHDYPS